MISDLYINPSFLSFLKIFFRAWENAARLFFNIRDVVFTILVKFYFVGLYTSLVFFQKPTYVSKY